MDKPAKVVVVGTGAMGSVYAALMKDAGHDVWAIDTWAEHIAAIESNGLRVEGKSGDRTVRLPASRTAADAGGADLVIIATKYDRVRAAAESVLPILKDETPVLSIQNGLGGPDQAVEVLGADRVTMGVVGGFGASMKGPGHAHHNGMEMVRLGEYKGGVRSRTDWIAEVWRSSGFSVSTFDDIHKMVWEKLICNCAFSGPC
ncbi:MAG: 2-dehydropantoate 2-reductase, partial [Pseudomonadota bacterium]